MNLSLLTHADNHLSDHILETNLSVLTQTDEFSGEKDSMFSEYLRNKSLDTYFPRNDEHDSYGVKLHFTQNTEQGRAWYAYYLFFILLYMIFLFALTVCLLSI